MEIPASRKNTTLPNQRVSLKTKQTEKWTKDMADYIINLAISCNDKTKTKTYLDMANGVVDKSMYEYVLKSYGVKDNELSKSKNHQQLISELRNINLLSPIKDRYLGEFTSSYNNYQVYTDDPDTVFLRNKEFGASVLDVMNKMLINVLNQQNINTGQESQPVPNIGEMLEEYIQTWDDKRAESAQLRLNLLNNEIDARLKYNQAYYYWWACEELYTYRTVHKNSVLFEVVSPLEYYRIPSGNTYVEDDDYGVRICYRSLYQILDLYEEHLSKSDIDFLKAYVSKDITNETRMGILKSRAISNGMSSEDFIVQSANTVGAFNNHDLIPVVHYFGKTEVKVGYLTFRNEAGALEETLVDETYVLNPEAGDIDIVWDWKHEIYEGEILGFNIANAYNTEAVYTKFRPITIQREKFSNINICKAPYNGLSYIHKDSAKEPIPARINPYLALYRIYHYQIEKAIQRWKSILPIPQSILTDDANMSMEERLAYMGTENFLVFNDAEINANAIQAMREIATTATYNYINTIYQLLQGIKQEAWEVANMTATRMGNQKAYQGKGTTEQSLQQTEIASNWSLDIFNLFRAKDYLANYDYSKIAWADGKMGSFIDESTNELKRVEVDPMEHFSLNVGINVGNSRMLDEKLRAMKELAFSAAQGGEYELATEAIMNDNLQVLKSKILAANKAKREFEKSMEDAKNAAMIQAKEIEQQTKQMEQEFKLQEITIKGDKEIEKALILQETELLVWNLRLQQDTNGNGYIDDEESLNTSEVLAKIEFQRKQLDIKYQELALKKEALKQSKQNKSMNK